MECEGTEHSHMAEDDIQHDWSQVLQLVVPYINTREMHVRLTIVSQHMQHIMQTHIRQHIATYLKRYFSREAWLPSTDEKRMRREWRSAGACPSVKWLCALAGAEAMGTAAVVAAVLSDERNECYSRKGTAQVVIEAGLRLTDVCVAAAAAGAQPQEYVRVAQQVAALLQATPPQHAEQHSGLTPLMRFACTSGPGVPIPSELPAWADAMPQQQLFDVLLVMVDSFYPHIDAFQLLLNCLLLKQQCPEAADSSSSEATPLQHRLVQLLRASLHDQCPMQETCVAAIVDAMLSLPPDTHPDPSTCLQLLVRAESCFPAAIPHLAALPGIQALPQEVFYGLLCSHTHMPEKRLDTLEQLLKLPHAQHITGSQLSQLLAHCIDPCLMFGGQGVQALLSLPAADNLDNQEALQVLKTAATYDGRLLAEARRSQRKVNEHAKVWGIFERLAWHLTEAGAVELFQQVIQYRWHDFIPTLMACEPLMEQLSPEGLAAVLRKLVTNDLWINQQSMGHDQTQLQDTVLDIDLIQALGENYAFAMMHTLAELGYPISPVVSKVQWAGAISSEQVAALLRLALRNGESYDVWHLAQCGAAHQLQADFVLEVVTRVLDGWPIIGRSPELDATRDTPFCNLYRRQDALVLLLELPAAASFTSADCVVLAKKAADAGSLEAFIKLCCRLPQLQSAREELPVPVLLRMYQLAIDDGCDDELEQLVWHSASEQLSTSDLQPLLLQAISKASRWSSSLEPASWRWDRRRHGDALRLPRMRDSCIKLLLAEQACLPVTVPSETAKGMSELLDACILHGVFSTARALLQQPVAQQMDAEQLEQLLLTYFNVDNAHLHTQQGEEHKHAATARQLLVLLLQHPAAAALDAAALCRLIAGRGVFAAAAAAARSRERQRLMDGTVCTSSGLPDDEGKDALDPVGELLVGLPAVQQYDAASLAAVLAAAAESRVSSRVFERCCAVHQQLLS